MGKILNNQEINNIAKEFIELRTKLKKNRNKKNQSKFEAFQNEMLKKLSYLVILRTNKYKMFSNYSDLQQEGFEALFMALKTYKPERGDFSWWAQKYINTRVSRAANSHSTIKYPLKMIKDFKPHKVKSIPKMNDTALNPQESFENTELKNAVFDAINLLPEIQQKVIKLSFEMLGNRGSTISKISEELKIPKSTCAKILSEAKENLRETLANLNNMEIDE